MRAIVETIGGCVLFVLAVMACAFAASIGAERQMRAEQVALPPRPAIDRPGPTPGLLDVWKRIPAQCRLSNPACID